MGAVFSNTLQVEGRSQNICLGRTLDVLKLLPSLCWGVMSFFAFPAYLSMGWYTPVVLSVLSTLLSIGFAYECIMYHRRFKYVVAGEYLLGWDQTQPDYPVAKIAAVSLILLLAIVATIVLLHTYYSYIEPCDARYNKDGSNSTDGCPDNLKPAPCNGRCEGCVDDPDCKAWTEFLMAQEGMTKICPPPNDHYEGDATFSCAADGYCENSTGLSPRCRLTQTVAATRDAVHLLHRGALARRCALHGAQVCKPTHPGPPTH